MIVPSAVGFPFLLLASMSTWVLNSSAAPEAVAAISGSAVKRVIVDNDGTRYDQVVTALDWKS